MQGATGGFQPWTVEEDAVLREVYEREGYKAACARLSGRSHAAIFHRAQRLGLKAKRRWTAVDDEQLRYLWNSGVRLNEIAKALKRTPLTTYWRAQTLGLQLGCPHGFEYLSEAAKRTGYTTTQLRPILRWADVPISIALARPTASKRRAHFVDPFDVDEALMQWHATEPLETAARRVGVCGETLKRWLHAVGVTAPADRAHRAHWRVAAQDVVRAVVASARCLPGARPVDGGQSQ